MKISNLQGKSLLNWKDWNAKEIHFLLSLSHKVKKEARKGTVMQRFKGKTLAMIFEKRSTRTRCAFETAFAEEGGHPVFLSLQDLQLGSKESVEDTAKVLGRMFSAIEFRGFKQETVEILARDAGVPVYNGLTDLYHPTQVLADIMTIEEVYSTARGRSIAFIGDGKNNVVRSLAIICSKLAINLIIISPCELQADDDLLQQCSIWAKESGSTIKTSCNLSDVEGADVVYTDVWVSMGEESKAEERKKILSPYQVNENLLAQTKNPNCIFLHCLPAVKEEEVTNSVFNSQNSFVFDQAENRKHTIKAIMLATLS